LGCRSIKDRQDHSADPIPRPRVSPVDSPCDGRGGALGSRTRPFRFQQLKLEGRGFTPPTHSKNCSDICASRPSEFSGPCRCQTRSEHIGDVAVWRAPMQGASVRRPDGAVRLEVKWPDGRLLSVPAGHGRLFRSATHTRISHLTSPNSAAWLLTHLTVRY